MGLKRDVTHEEALIRLNERPQSRLFDIRAVAALAAIARTEPSAGPVHSVRSLHLLFPVVKTTHMCITFIARE